MEEVRGATEGEGIASGLLPKGFEEFDRLAIGEDVKCEVISETLGGYGPR